MQQPVTLIIPTYNRPRSLARLLAFIRARAPSIPCVVLDSGAPESQAEVRQTCEKISAVELCQFAESIRFYEKLQAGLLHHVKTPFVCLCADDDVVDPVRLLEAAKILESNPDLSVVHGFYAHFQLGRKIVITDLGYHGQGIDDDDPIVRVSRLLSDYEATLYGVQRTEILLGIMEHAVEAPSLLSAELLVGVLAVASGKTQRLQVFSHARNMAPSHFSEGWHPTELLAMNPKAVVEGLVFIRQRLESWLTTHGHMLMEEDLIPADLAMTVYVSEYLTPESARAALNRATKGEGVHQMREGAWHDAAVRSQSSNLLAALRNTFAVRWLKSKLGPNVSLLGPLRWAASGFQGMPQEVKFEIQESGKQVSVRLDRLFLNKLRNVSLPVHDPDVQELAQMLSDYVCAGEPGESKNL